MLSETFAVVSGDALTSIDLSRLTSFTGNRARQHVGAVPSQRARNTNWSSPTTTGGSTASWKPNWAGIQRYRQYGHLYWNRKSFFADPEEGLISARICSPVDGEGDALLRLCGGGTGATWDLASYRAAVRHPDGNTGISPALPQRKAGCGSAIPPALVRTSTLHLPV